jgi:hypothetical protein
MIKTKWLIYTVIIGLIPFFIRFFVFLFYTERTFDILINEIDFIVFGLILNLANINELEDKNNIDRIWKSKNIGFSILQIIVFSSILGLAYFSDILKGNQLDKDIIKVCAVVLSLVSLYISYSIFNRINTIAHGNN